MVFITQRDRKSLRLSGMLRKADLEITGIIGQAGNDQVPYG
jgi:hypothetical protein